MQVRSFLATSQESLTTSTYASLPSLMLLIPRHWIMSGRGRATKIANEKSSRAFICGEHVVGPGLRGWELELSGESDMDGEGGGGGYKIQFELDG